MIRFADKGKVEKDLHDLLNTYGVYCVSKKWNQCLMWAHYSDSHTGFCMGFEFDQEFDDELGMAYEVKYAESYPKISPELFGSDAREKTKELIELSLATKSVDWSYEAEVRFIKRAHEGGSRLSSIRSDKVKEVIIGACASDEDKNEIQATVEMQMPWVKIYKARISKSKYEIYREKIT